MNEKRRFYMVKREAGGGNAPQSDVRRRRRWKGKELVKTRLVLRFGGRMGLGTTGGGVVCSGKDGGTLG